MKSSNIFALILKVGTGILTLSVLTKGVDASSCETERFEVPYKGIKNGFFCDENDFSSSLKKLFSKAKKSYKKIFSCPLLHVNVPEEFTSVVKRIATVEFSSRQLINNEIMFALKQIAERDFLNNEKYTLKYIFPESYTIDDKKLPSKIYSDTYAEKYISLNANIVLLKRRALIAIENAVSKIMDCKLKVFTVTDAIIQSMRQDNVLDKDYLLIDISENSTSFAYVCDGMFSALRNLSLGLNSFVDSISKSFKLNYDEALAVLSQYNVYSMSGDKKVEISIGKSKFSCKQNDIFMSMNKGLFPAFLHYVKVAFNEIKSFIPYDLKIIFTGDGMMVPGLDVLLQERLALNTFNLYKIKNSFRSVGIVSGERFVLNNLSEGTNGN